MMFSDRIATTVAMLAIFVAAAAMALSLPQKAAFMPLLVSIPGILLCLWQLALDLLGRTPKDAPAAGEARSDSHSELKIFLWLGLFAVALIGFGFVIGGPLIVFAFVRFASGESWRNALVAGGGTFAVVWGVFIWLLELPLFEGLVLEALL